MTFDFPRAGRRATSTIVVGLLAGAIALSGLAAPAAAQTSSAGQTIGMQKLVDELSDQFWFAFRGNVPEHRHRHSQLRKAIEAWNKSGKTAEDRQLMTKWLRDAMQSSMPGSPEELPTLPDFGKTAAPAASQTTTSKKPVVPKSSSSVAGEPADGQTQAEQDYWFSQSSEAASAEQTEQGSGETWAVESSESKPADSPTNSDPFGDDPLGL